MVGGKGAYRMVGGAAHLIKVRDKKKGKRLHGSSGKRRTFHEGKDNLRIVGLAYNSIGQTRNNAGLRNLKKK